MAYVKKLSREKKYEGLRFVNACLGHLYAEGATLGLNTRSDHAIVSAAQILERIRSNYRTELGHGAKR